MDVYYFYVEDHVDHFTDIYSIVFVIAKSVSLNSSTSSTIILAYSLPRVTNNEETPMPFRFFITCMVHVFLKSQMPY